MSHASLKGHSELTMEKRMAHYLTRIAVHPETGCWLWLGARRSVGYARAIINYKDHMLHQVFYERFVGERPAGSVVHHVCETKHCLYPEHLQLVTRAEHALLHGDNRMSATRESARKNRAITHCKYGHEFSPENTYWNRHGWRCCRACNAKRQRERSHAKAQAETLFTPPPPTGRNHDD